MEDSGSRRRVGREALLRAAADVFIEQGYAATSIDAIIARTGGSKRNIYSEFGSKAGLFTAIVAENVEKALWALAIEGMKGGDLRVTLVAFGRELLEVLMSPAILGVYRIAIAESARIPELVRRFYEHGPGRASARLAEVLAAAEARGEIAVDDCATAADLFGGMIRGNLHMQVVLGLRAPPNAAEAEALVGHAVAIFLDGVQPRAALAMA